jgi:hypothetical protein
MTYAESSQISAGGSIIFTISFYPLTVGEKSAVVTINNNYDVEFNNYTIDFFVGT